jgi:hypothetical protein
MDYFEEPFVLECDEHWEFNSAINELIQKEVESRTSDIRSDYENVKINNEELVLENNSLKQQIYEHNNKINGLSNRDNISDKILSKLSKDNIRGFVEFAYEADFKESGSMDGAPLWFELIINHYSNRQELFDVFKICRIEVPSWATTFRLPFDWTKDELDHFFDTMYNHYVCNGQIYSGNINFWYREIAYRDIHADPIKNMDHNYSEIPWQFVLRHPLLNTKEYCEKMANAINKGGNGRYFAAINEFQKLSDENLATLVNCIDIGKQIRDFTDSNSPLKQLIMQNLQLIHNRQKLDLLYPLIIKIWDAEKYLSKMPKDYCVDYMKSVGVSNKNKILESTLLTKEEKLELLAEVVE